MGMKPKTNKGSRRGDGSLPVLEANAAGIDIGSSEHWVAVPIDRDDEHVLSFLTPTAPRPRCLSTVKVTASSPAVTSGAIAKRGHSDRNPVKSDQMLTRCHGFVLGRFLDHFDHMQQSALFSRPHPVTSVAGSRSPAAAASSRSRSRSTRRSQ